MTLKDVNFVFELERLGVLWFDREDITDSAERCCGRSESELTSSKTEKGFGRRRGRLEIGSNLAIFKRQSEAFQCHIRRSSVRQVCRFMGIHFYTQERVKKMQKIALVLLYVPIALE